MVNLSISKMKILHIAPISHKRASGPSSSVVNLAIAQANLGHQVGIIPSLPTIFPPNVVSDNITILDSPSKKHLNPWKLSKKWITYVENKFGDPDIVNFHDTYIPFHIAFSRLCNIAGWAYTITPRGGLGKLAQKLKAYKKAPANVFFFKKYINNATLVHALSKTESRDIKRKFGDVATTIISNGVDKNLLKISDKIKTDLNKNYKEKITIGFIGRIDVYHKGIDLLLNALSQFQTNHKEKYIELIIIGPFHTKKDKNSVEKIIKKMPYKKNIIIKEKLFGSEKWKELNSFDIFVHTSRFEGIPNSVLEAMAFGKPCIVTKGTNLSSLINDNKCGWACETSLESIYKALVHINKKGWNDIFEFGINAKELIKKHHLMEHIANKYINSYESLLNDDFVK